MPERKDMDWNGCLPIPQHILTAMTGNEMFTFRA